MKQKDVFHAPPPPLVDIEAQCRGLSSIPCICGCKEMNLVDDIPSAFPLAKSFARHDVKVGECKKCGIFRIIGPPYYNDEEMGKFYANTYPPVCNEYSAKNWNHDIQLAEKRCAEYGIREGTNYRILDVGSGSGAFVVECRRRGAEACGCELSKYHYADSSEDEWVYRERLEDINFPTDYFDIVTCHDTLEHVLDPVKMLEEMFRITKQNGECFLDFPNYFDESGGHHWKHEHLWYFNRAELRKLLKKVGFKIVNVSQPIQSKLLFNCKKPNQQRASILVPPGIGDSFWSVIKLEAFIEKHKLGIPDVCIVCNRDKAHDGHKRSVPFLRMFPFINCTGKVFVNNDSPKLRKIWKEAYGRPGRTCFEGVHDCDYFISYNGHLRVGESMDEIDPHLKTNWHPKRFVSLEERRFKEESVKKYGEYIVWYLPFFGTYKYWLNEFPVEKVIEFVLSVTEYTGLTPVFTGAAWDRDDNPVLDCIMDHIPNAVDLRGETSVEQLFGLINGSTGVVGFPSGLTIMAATFGVRTFMIWNDFYNRDFAWYCCPPEVKNKTYFIENTKNIHDVAEFSQRVSNIISGKEVIIQETVKPKKPLKVKKKKKERVSTQQTLDVIREVVRDSKTGMTVACVLRSGGHFDISYVEKLRNMLYRNVTAEYSMVCLTDIDFNLDGVDIVPLKHGYDRWWSKIELFRPGVIQTDRVLYFDLDTVIIGNIDDLFKLNGEFLALQPWNSKNRKKGFLASGMMLWKPKDYTFVYADFHEGVMSSCQAGDQEYVSKELALHNKQYVPLQNVVSGIYSYKRNCRHGLPKDARIVCFHGRPRPHMVNEQWVLENWK